MIGSDHFSAYLKYARENDAVASQFCWAHLIRDIRFVQELCGPGVREIEGSRETELWATTVLASVKKLFKGWHRGRKKMCREARAEILGCCHEHWPTDDGDVRRLQQRIKEHAESHFRFLEVAGVEPTNNAAERCLRKVVLHRKATQGTRGENGRRWWERVFSVRDTLRKRGASLFEFIAETLQAAAAGLPPPSALARA